MRYFLLFIFWGITINSFAATGEIVIEGVYQGKNLFIQNPLCGDKKENAILEVIVNNKSFSTNIRSSAFEVDLSGFQLNEPLTIRLIHREDCLPKVINLQAIVVHTPFEFKAFSIRPDSILWETSGENVETVYFVERWLNNKWVAITPPISATGPFENAAYLIKTKHDFGVNKYRIKSLTSSGQILYSDVQEYSASVETVSSKP